MRKYNELKKLAALIRKIVDLVKECGGNASLKFDVDRDALMIRKTERKEMLLKDLYLKWDDKHHLDAESASDGKGLS